MIKNRDLCQEWLNEIERLYGKDRRDKSNAYYDRGWYCIGLATKYSDGSIGCQDWMLQHYREKELIKIIETLKKRNKNDG